MFYFPVYNTQSSFFPSLLKLITINLLLLLGLLLNKKTCLLFGIYCHCVFCLVKSLYWMLWFLFSALQRWTGTKVIFWEKEMGMEVSDVKLPVQMMGRVALTICEQKPNSKMLFCKVLFIFCFVFLLFYFTISNRITLCVNLLALGSPPPMQSSRPRFNRAMSLDVSTQGQASAGVGPSLRSTTPYGMMAKQAMMVNRMGGSQESFVGSAGMYPLWEVHFVNPPGRGKTTKNLVLQPSSTFAFWSIPFIRKCHMLQKQVFVEECL